MTSLRVIAVSPSQIVTVCRKVASYQVSCAITFRSKVVVSVQHHKALGNHSCTTRYN